MPYRLIKVLYDSPVTGELLHEMLTAENFTVPVKISMPNITAPVRPTIAQGSSPEAVTQWNRYTIEFRAYALELKSAQVIYFKQFTDFALRLAQEFVIVDSVTLQPKVGYSYKSAAAKLMGQYAAPVIDPINFICFKNFG